MATKENELVPFTFPDSGYTVLVKKASPILMMKLRQKFPAPLPPKQPVSYGGDIGVVMEENPASPEYQQAMQTYEANLEEMVRKLYIKRAVRVRAEDKDIAKKKAAEVREDWKEATSTDLDGTDDFIFISYVCMETDRDLEKLIEAVTRSSFRDGEGHTNGNPDAQTEV